MKNKKNNIFFLFTLLCAILFFNQRILCTSNWKSSGSAAAGDEDKQHINFYGTLTTHQGQKDTVDHILIEGKHKDILMYDAPIKHAKEIFNQKTKQTEIKLTENPVTDFMNTKIDLNTIQTMKISNSNTVWVYQKEKKYQRMEFLMVEITSKESSKTKQYLLEKKVHISCSAIDNGSQKKEVPLPAIDTLTIEGYSFILSPEEAKKNRPAPCPTKVTLSETVEMIQDNKNEENIT